MAHGSRITHIRIYNATLWNRQGNGLCVDRSGESSLQTTAWPQIGIGSVYERIDTRSAHLNSRPGSGARLTGIGGYSRRLTLAAENLAPPGEGAAR